jgi:hypothetical protein
VRSDEAAVESTEPMAEAITPKMDWMTQVATSPFALSQFFPSPRQRFLPGVDGVNNARMPIDQRTKRASRQPAGGDDARVRHEPRPTRKF